MIDLPPLAWAYGALAGAVSGLALWSRCFPLLYGAGTMVASWSMSNWAVTALGFSGMPLVVPEADAVLAILLALVATATSSRALAIVFALFIAEETAHVAFLIVNSSQMVAYIGVLNAIFVVQCLVVGGASAGTCMAMGVPRRGPGAAPAA